MKFSKLVLVFAILLFTNQMVAQITFSKRPNTDRLNAVYNAIVELDNGYVISGIAVDTNYSIFTGTEILLLDFDGNIVEADFLVEEGKHIEAWGTEAEVFDNNYFYTGYTRENGHTKILIGRYDLSNGDHRYNDLGHPGFPVQFVVAGFGMIRSGGNFFAFGRRHQTDIDSEYGSNGFVLKYDSDLNILDSIILEIPVPFSGNVYSLIGLQSGEFLAYKWKRDRSTVCKPYTGFEIIKLDSAFNEIEIYESPEQENWGIESALYQSESGDIYLHASRIEPNDFVYGPGPDDCITDLWTAPAIRKFNSDLEPIWEKDFHRSVDYASVSNVTDIFEANDGNLVTAYDMTAEGDSFVLDHLTHLVKFDTSGNLIWRRLFYHYDSIGTWNAVRDLKPTSDGGYIMVGEMRYNGDPDSLYPGEALGQQGWIIKVDEFGCLIPGCEGPLNNEEYAPQSALSVLTFPNPTTDVLYFTLSNDMDVGTRYLSARILDMNGREWQKLPTVRHFSDITYSISVDQLPPGPYILQVQLDNERISQSFLKH